MYKIHVFEYSKREGTKAAEMKEQVLPDIKNKRSKIIIELSNKIGEKYNREYIGKILYVLVEEEKERKIFWACQ